MNHFRQTENDTSLKQSTKNVFSFYPKAALTGICKSQVKSEETAASDRDTSSIRGCPEGGEAILQSPGSWFHRGGSKMDGTAGKG